MTDSGVCAGIDAGGSHSEIVLLDSGRRVLARARGPAAALRPDNVDDVVRIVTVGISEALAHANRSLVRGLVVGAAGAGRPEERRVLEGALREHRVADRVKVIGDGEAAFHSAFGNGPGILLIAGTGSIAYARGASGELLRTGGLGWQLGDEGGGYAIGRAGLGAVGRAAEGRGPATSLSDVIARATGTSDLDGLIRWAQGARREQVAALAIRVGAAADAGDPVAAGIVDQAAADLAAHADALIRRLGPGAPPDIALGGGLLGPGAAVRRRLAALLGERPGLRVIDATVDPALGAATLALQL